MKRIYLERMIFDVTLFRLILMVALLNGIVFGEISEGPIESSDIVCREIRPSQTNPIVTTWDEPHYVCTPANPTVADGRLFVFLPGTGGTPNDYTLLTKTAAQAGLHAIALRYPNDKSINLQLCRLSRDPDCHGKVRTEIVNGVDASPLVDVDEANAIVGRLRHLLRHLAEMYPSEGWGRFLDAHGDIIWDLVVVSGHSQGSGHAAFIAFEHLVDHVILFAWVDISRGEPAAWLLEKPSLTPAQRYYLFWHEQDTGVTKHANKLIDALGLTSFGSSVILDGAAPPYRGGHSLIATATPPQGQRAHNVHVVDWALALDEQGKPLYRDMWRYLIELRTEESAEVSYQVIQADTVWFDQDRQRELPVRIYAPGPIETSPGPFPGIVFSHGGGESREAFTYLGKALARRGYLVVFLTHKGSDREAWNEQGMRALGATAFDDRPQDVRFAIDRLLAADLNDPLLAGRIDTERIAVAGQCAGATTALAVAGLTTRASDGSLNSYHDPRPKAVVALSPQPGVSSRGSRKESLHYESWKTVNLPAMVITGSKDFQWMPAVQRNPSLVRRPYTGMSPGHKYLVDIVGAEHHAFTDSKPYYPGGPRNPRHHGWISQATIAFLDAYLKEDANKLKWLQSEALEAETQGECIQEQKLMRVAEAVSRIPAPSRDRKGKSFEEDAVSRALVQKRVAQLLRLYDRNGDAALSRAESPVRLKAVFGRIDANGDRKLSREELAPVLQRFQERGERPQNTTTQPGDSRAPHAVGVVEEIVLHDAKRDKDLTFRITYPEADGKFPIILFSHCVGGKRDDFKPLAEHWAANGYVVLQADHADTGRMGSDWRERTRDMSFMIDSLGRIEGKVPQLASRMDATRIGAGGHLIGAYAACALAGLKGKGFGPGNETADFMNPRVDAVLLLGPQGRGQELNETSWEEIDIPMLVAAGSRMPSRRTSNPPEWRTEPYRLAKPGDKYLLWVEGMDPGYAGLCRGGIEPKPAKFVRDVTTAFWDAHLKSDAQTRQRLRAWPIPKADMERFRLECKVQAPSSEDKRQGSEPIGENSLYDFSRLDEFLKKSAPRLGGGCAFILIKGDRVIHRNAYGAFTPEKVVPIASSSKWISGGVIMALVDAGKISLDDPASKYLPYFTGKKAGITIRQMFSHTHGLQGNAREHLWNTRLTMDEAVREIAKVELIADPGKALYYSGLGMQVAGRICEIATGKPWAEIFRETLGDPLGMDSTDYFGLGPTRNPNVAGAGRTCVDDYGNYLTMLLNRGLYKGKRVLPEKAIATMFSNQSGNVPILRHAYDVLDCVDPALAKAPYGVGCWLEDFDPKTGKTSQISSGGGFGCMPFLDLKRNVAGVLLPHNRKWKMDTKGRRYNDAHRVYYEAKAIINEILDAGAQPQVGAPPRTPNAAVRQSTPSETAAGDSVKVHGDLAADYSARNGGRAVLVMIDGRIVFERYDNGFSSETATHLHSATKGFWGPVIAAMIEDGLIESFDELAAKTLPEWEDHPRKSRITLRHLLSLNAGLVQDVINLQGHDRPTLAPDLYKHAIGVRAPRKPGAFFQYGPSCYYVLGEIMKSKLADRKQTPLDYLKQRILDPIGVKINDWVHDKSGNPHIPNGAYLTARQWAKYGQWLLQMGKWEGKQIVRKDLLEELVKPSKANPGHGMALWLNQPGGQGAVGVAGQRSEPGDKTGWIYRNGHADLVAALGASKCRMYIIPSLNMVVLRQGDTRGDRYDDNTFLSLLLTGQTPNVITRRGSDRAGPEAEAILQRFDRDSDGKLDTDELRRMPNLRQADTDEDGSVTLGEVREFYRSAQSARPRQFYKITSSDNMP